MDTWDATTDVAVVGSGGGALTAALKARALGLDVLIVEKAGLIGGSTAMSGGGLWIPDSPPMREAGSQDSPDDALAYLNAVIQEDSPATSQARKTAFIQEGPKVIAFLQDQGVPFRYADGYSDYYCDAPGGKDRGRTIEAAPYDTSRLGPYQQKLRPGSTKGLGLVGYGAELTRMSYYNRSPRDLATGIRVLARTYGSRLRGQDLVANGGALVGRLLELAIRSGVRIETETTLTEILADDGAVTGIVVQKSTGKTEKIKARKAVLLAAGGFSRSDELRKQYGGDQAKTAEWSLASPGDTGEALQLAVRLGAATDLMDEAIWLPGPRMPDGSPPPAGKSYTGKRLNAFSRARWRPGSVLVDADGQRFVNEAVSYMEVGQRMFARNQTVKAIPSWLIFDDAFRRRSLFGVIPGDLPRQWITDGFIQKAASLEALARQIGVNPGQLIATIQIFNQNANNQTDPGFHRGDRAYDKFMGDPRLGALAPLAKPPYYASAQFPSDVGTCGGLLTDEHARVLSDKNEPIRNLYAAGNIAASVMGRHYVGAGASIAPALVFGYRAINHVTGEAGA